MRGGGSDDEAALGGGAASPGLKKGPWTGAEDAVLMEYVRKHGEGNWNAVQKNSGLSRCGKSCRLRWANHLRPHLKKGSFTPEEELLILRLHAQLGNKWARMAAQLPGRTDNEIKNYWNTRIKRRQRAGLPLYPPEIHRQTAVHHRPSLTVAPSVNLCDPTAGFPSKPVLELPTIKRIHNNGVFQFFASPSPLALYGSPSATGKFGLGNFHPNPAPAPDVSIKTELPSSQCHMFPEPPVAAGDGNSGLLDALLLESQGVGGEPPPPPAAAAVAGSGGGGEFVSKLDDFTGMEKKSGEEAMEIDQVQENHITMLLDMIPATTTDHWYNSTDSGQSSSAVTEDEIGREMQQLASSLSIAPAEGDWGIGSCSWNNMPGIC